MFEIWVGKRRDIVTVVRGRCWVNPRNGGTFLGARLDHDGNHGWYVPACEAAALVPGGAFRIVVADAEAPDGFERERESLRRACRDAPPPPQCRSGDTAGGVWVARDASRPSCGAYTGRPEGRFAGLAAVDVDRDPKLWAQEERKRDALRAANGPTGDRWRYALPGCAYHYFDGGELERALAAEAPLVLFVGDSTARLLYVAFAEWLGAAITDTELYLDPSGDGAQFVSGAARVAYLQMWSEDQYRSLVLGPCGAPSTAPATAPSRRSRLVVDGVRAALPGALRFVFQSAPCGLGRRQGNFRTGKSLEGAPDLPARLTEDGAPATRPGVLLELPEEPRLP
ncbi:hypothetical protein JL720_16644 [Aureococcus anophagefferens]|nr:hypothetical protein JL720_16644 [Aureococcus anophagefferens]